LRRITTTALGAKTDTVHPIFNILAGYILLCVLVPTAGLSQKAPDCPFDKLATIESARALLQKAASYAPEPVAAKIRSLEIKHELPEQMQKSKKRIGEAVDRLENSRVSDGSSEEIRAGLTNAKGKILNALALYAQPWLEIRLRNSIQLYDAFFYLDSFYFSQRPKTRAFYAELLNRPELEPAARIVGELYQMADSDFERQRLATALEAVSDLFRDKPDLIANEMLTRLGKRFLFLISHSGTTNGTRNNVNFAGKSLSVFLGQNLPGSRARFIDRLREELGDLSETHQLSATEPYIIDSLMWNDHPEVRMLLRRFVSSGHFDKLHEKDRGALFYHLSEAQLRAARSSNPQFKRLWHNTLEAILTGEVKVSVENLGTSKGGSCMDSNIRLNRGFMVNSDEIGTGRSLNESMLHTIAHEVYHARNGFSLRSSSVYYFEEEMDAWQVGFFAANERLPNKREAALRAVFLLTTEAYPDIASAWKRDPGSFARHLEQLGLDAVSDADALKVNTKEAAPQWGWEGYLENLPTPSENIQMEKHLKALALHAKGELRKELNLAVVPLFPSRMRIEAAYHHFRFRNVRGLIEQTTEAAKGRTPQARALRALRKEVLWQAIKYYVPAHTFIDAPPHFKAIQFFQPPHFSTHNQHVANTYLTLLTDGACSESRFALGELLLIPLDSFQKFLLVEQQQKIAPHLERIPKEDANRLILNHIESFRRRINSGTEFDLDALIQRYDPKP
jgi:ribosomal protein S15P/S13E